MFGWFRKKIVDYGPPPIAVLHSNIDKAEALREQKHQLAIAQFKKWFLLRVRKYILERMPNGIWSDISFNIDPGEGISSNTEYGTVFRQFYESGVDWDKVSGCRDAVIEMHRWVINEFAEIYLKAGYEVSIFDGKTLRISWRKK